VIDEIEVTVRPGDSMWQLAEKRMRQWRGDALTDADVAPYWLAVIAANHDRIRSGDPDLIFPGEVLILPEWG
jgi:nucleoid-associated protein YgaU